MKRSDWKAVTPYMLYCCLVFNAGNVLFGMYTAPIYLHEAVHIANIGTVMSPPLVLCRPSQVSYVSSASYKKMESMAFQQAEKVS